jgi:hypothetical protein
VTSKPGDLDETRAWLAGEPSLEQLQHAFPDEWETVRRQLAEVVPKGDRAELQAYVRSLASPPQATRPGRNLRARERAQLAAEIRRRMAAAAIRQLSLSAATGVTDGRVRFNLVNGWVAQRLLFERDLERKPVSLFWFRLLWPLLWQRRFLMPLVAPKGIYCFYSKPLVTRLAAMIGDRSCLEIAAGDGTLSRFLAEQGVRVTATDDYSWKDVRFSAFVIRQDARDALKTRRPEVVVCSWPPAGNSFERDVFRTQSVDLYVVIASRHRFAAGAWEDYERQRQFDVSEDPVLSALVLPPELDAAVYVCRRRSRRS